MQLYQIAAHMIDPVIHWYAIISADAYTRTWPCETTGTEGENKRYVSYQFFMKRSVPTNDILTMRYPHRLFKT